MVTKSSKNFRANSLFMRNSFETSGKWNIPLVHKQEIKTSSLSLIAYSDTRKNDNELNCKKGVHFFVDDYRFEAIYRQPERTLEKLSQYAFLLSPDFSTYADMNLWRQMESVAKNRWIGAYWQSKGFYVVPTISWSTPRSFEFCFDGVEKNATVAVGMIGCKKSHIAFMRGYNEMLHRLEPEKIIVFGHPFPEMDGNIITVDYIQSRKVVR